MASIVTKLFEIYQECRELHLDVKLSLEIRDGQEYFNFSRTPKPSMTVSAGTPRTAGKKSSPRDTRRREEWWERRRRQLVSQASPTLRSYSDAVRNTTQVPQNSRQEQSSGIPVPSFVERKEQRTKSSETDHVPAATQREPPPLPPLHQPPPQHQPPPLHQQHPLHQPPPPPAGVHHQQPDPVILHQEPQPYQIHPDRSLHDR